MPERNAIDVGREAHPCNRFFTNFLQAEEVNQTTLYHDYIVTGLVSAHFSLSILLSFPKQSTAGFQPATPHPTEHHCD